MKALISETHYKKTFIILIFIIGLAYLLMDYFIKNNTTFTVYSFGARSAQLLLCDERINLKKIDNDFTVTVGIPCDHDDSVMVAIYFSHHLPLYCEIGIVAVTGGQLSTGRGLFERRNRYSADHECNKFQVID